MSVQRTNLKWLKHSCVIAATCFSLNAYADGETIWSDTAGDVVNDGAGDCLHTILWNQGNPCTNSAADANKHTHPATATAAALEHSHEGGSMPHSHEAKKPAAEKKTDAPKPATTAAIAAVPFSLSSSAAFKTGGSDLSAEGKAEVAAFAEKLEGHEVNSITVEGYTDNRGPAAYNKDLSEKRAKAVKAEMIENGIDASLITVIGHGASDPIADNETAAGRAKNRRVTVSVDVKN